MSGVGKPAIPTILRLMSNAPAWDRSSHRLALENAWNQVLDHGDTEQREEAAIALSVGGWALNKEELIPILASTLASRSAETRKAAMLALLTDAHYFTAARDAIRNATNSPNADARKMANEAIERFGGIERLNSFD